MHGTLLATRPLTIVAKTNPDCGRCGITYERSYTVKGERANYCSDCRGEATLLGWCEPDRRATRHLAAAA